MTDVIEPTGEGEAPSPLEPPLALLAPLIYVAWADGTLEDAEIRGICQTARQEEWLDAPCQEALDRWLDPDSPPEPRALQALLRQIRQAGRQLPPEERESLARLGAGIARAGAPDGKLAAGTLEGLSRLEAALGVVGAEAARSLLGVEEPVETVTRPAPFDVEEMHRLLDGDHHTTRQKLLDRLVQPDFHLEPGLSLEAHRARVTGWLRTLADEGWGELALPREYGGRGDIGRSIAALETLAFHDTSLAVKYGVQFGLFGGSILLLGTERHHQRFLRGVASLDIVGCFAMTETDHGSNVRALETTATYDPERGELVVHTPHEGARKDYIGNAARDGRWATVFAQLETRGESHGVHALLVPIRDEAGEPLPGVHIEDCGPKAGLDGVDNGRLRFDQVRVPRENLLDRFGDVAEDGTYSSPIPSAGRRFFTMLGTLVGGRIAIAGASNNAAKLGLDTAIRYTERRRQFGPEGAGEMPVLDYLLVQRRLLPALATTYALDFAQKALVRRYAHDPSSPPREIEGEAAVLKALASRHAATTLQSCREVCGGQGYLAINRIGPVRSDTDVFTTFEGANDVLLQLVAKGLLTEYGAEMGELKVWGLVRHLADRAATRLTELNPVAVRRTDDDHLLDPDFHDAALRYREERLLSTLGGRLKARIDEGVDSFRALNEVQDHVKALALAHAERLLLQRFREGIDGYWDEPIREVLGRLAALYALHRIEADRAWFLEAGYLEAAKSKAIRAAVNRLLQEVRPDALALVDALGIPAALRGPMGG